VSDVGPYAEIVTGGRGVHRLVALALPGVVAFDLSIAAQIFGHRSARSYYSFAVCAAQPGLVMSSTGFEVAAPFGLEVVGRADTVVVPGFDPLEAPDEASLAALREAATRGTRIASVCVGAFAVAAAGLLNSRTATTHWQHADLFRQRFPQVWLNPDVLYVDGGQVLTSAGISAGIDLCIHMVRQDYGEQVAADVARRMVVANHRTGGQLQYAHRTLPKDGGLGATREWAIAQMDRPLTVRHLARHAGVPLPLVHSPVPRRGRDEPDTVADGTRELGTSPTAYRRSHRPR
jgi:transcriptional regulator GlxA family with amidase domain